MAIGFVGDKRKRFLILLPIIFLLISAIFFQYAMKKIKDTILEEKYVETARHVDMLATAIDANESHPWEDHEQNIRASVNYLSYQPMTFAAAYKPVNGELTLITEKSGTTSFDPLIYSEFVDAASAQDSGRLDIEFAPDNGPHRVIHLYFRHMPNYSSPEERSLVVAGISQYSLVTTIPAWVSAGQWVGMAITFILNVWLIIMISRVGDISHLSECEVCKRGKW
jgi:hypothetical protein